MRKYNFDFMSKIERRYNTEYLNPFVPNAPFLYPLKASENLTVFRCFQGVEKGALGTNGLICELFKVLCTSITMVNKIIHNRLAIKLL